MLIETCILGGDEGIDKIWGDLIIAYVRAVLETDISQGDAIVGEHFRSLVAMRVLQLLEGRHKAQPSCREHDEIE